MGTLAFVGFKDKILAWDQLADWRESLRRQGRHLVVTNGCFDILHLGHVTYLECARAEGDVLLVGVNSDVSVRSNKGEGRPVNPEGDRAGVLAAQATVDAVVVFDHDNAMALLERVRPEVYAKGGDYTIDTIHQPERRLVESMGGKVVVLGGVPGRSTTGLLRRMGG
jgi:D-beta-D-heptose 7-phosphate kinase/D-beta-D-heptose 1-phosphate adenosyltransferase